jgi:DNA-directed RNA polymerase subunit RPC12/RpoP
MSETQCICNDGTARIKQVCVICSSEFNNLMTEMRRKYECPKHRIIACCGQYEYVCHDCKRQGWRSTAGTGTYTQHINDNTGEKRIPQPTELTGGPLF